MLNVQWHNHSLNLTEPAVDDFARAKIGVTIGRDIPRAEWIPLPAALRRRRLARYRYASLAAGEDCSKGNE